MKAMPAFIKTIICVGIIVPVLLMSFSRDVFAQNCEYTEYGPVLDPPADYCENYNCATSSTGICSVGFESYSCDYYDYLGGKWGCYYQVYSCLSSCGGGGGGGGHTPIWNGWHDVYFGEQTSATCTANGWVTDNYYGYPSDRDIPIRIYADQDYANPIYLGSASDYRSDLTGYCTNGTCAFNVDLNGKISYGVEHNILIFAGNFMLPAAGRAWTERKITCTAPPANTAPTGTLTCPSSPINLGNSASFALHGSDAEGNLSRAELWRSPATPSNPGGDWTAINANVACTGSSCNPPAVSWTPAAVGTYKIAANYFDSGTPAKQCSGNPFVTYPISGFEACANPLSNDYCTLQVVINGVCNNTVLNACTAGTFSDLADDSTNYLWECLGVNGGGNDSCSQAKPRVEGHVYSDLNNTCLTSSPTTSFNGVGVLLTAPDQSTTTVGGGAFSFSTVAGAHYLSVGVPAGYTCSPFCASDLAAGCPGRSVTPDSLNNNFFLTQLRGAWWQIDGAGAYAGGTSGTVVKSALPLASTKLITEITGDAGALFRSGGNVDVSPGSVSVPGWSTISTYKGTKMDYAYFAKKMGIIASMVPENKVSGMNSANDCTAVDGYCYVTATGTNATWNVGATDKYIVVVDGNFAINDNIVVQNGGFLAIIAKGNITVAGDVAVTQVQGLYVTSGNFVTDTVDVQLGVEGSVVAWGSVNLGRDLGADNINNPAEKFIFRPDLLLNMPDSMKSFGMEWQEVVPGTFGN